MELNTLNLMVTVGLGFVTAGGFWAFLNAVFTKGGRANTAKVIQEAQQVAQKTALDSAAQTYGWIKAECDRCNHRLDEVAAACDSLVDAVEAIRDSLPADDQRTLALNTALKAARKALY